MSLTTPKFLKVFSHPIRQGLMGYLTKSDLRVQELVEFVGQPQNVVSYHLHVLMSNGLIREHQSTADGREIYYSINFHKIKELYINLGEELHPALHFVDNPPKILPMNPHLRVIFLCTHNSARSQMAEGLLRTVAKGNIDVFSAGTNPSTVHPMAIRAMQAMNIDISQQYSKGISEFMGQNFDFVLTVCDRARENCPVFPGNPTTMHWSIDDPSSVTGNDQEMLQAFVETALELDLRIGFLLSFIERRQNMIIENESINHSGPVEETSYQ